MVSATATAPPDLEALLATWDRFLWRRCHFYGRRYALDAEELRADLLLALVRRFRTFDPTRAGFSTWADWVLRGTAKAAAVRSLTRVRTRRVTVIRRGETAGTDEVDLLDLTAADAPDPAAVVEERERYTATRDAVHAAIATLPEAQREAVRARYWGRRDGLASETNKRDLGTALAALRERLRPLAVEF